MRSRDRAAANKKRFRFLRFLLLVLLSTAVLLVALEWSWIDAQARTVVVLSSVLETPTLAPVVEAVTDEPRFADTSVAGNPAFVVRPRGEGPWPALFFVNGVVTEGRELPEVRRLAEGLARAGYLVVVPDLPGLRRGEIRPETVHETLEVARAISDRPDARDGKVGLVGVSTGATLALLAAEKADLDGRVSVVAGVAPYTDAKTVLDIATTGHYRKGGKLVRFEADPFLPGVITQSLVSTLPPGEDRETLLDELEEVDRLRPEFLADLRDMGPESRSVAEFLANEDPQRFDELYAGLPDGVRANMEELSPLAGDERLSVPVELIAGPQDKYFPVSESYAIVRIAPQARVTVTGALDHVEPSSSFRDFPAFLPVNGFVVRSLREARR
ncbi:MAG: alpha/beta fold hydrolase [Actinobacteria bacterium]|nr:alpha/beta fold hydrolase [Actinomycetota bacterium]